MAVRPGRRGAHPDERAAPETGAQPSDPGITAPSRRRPRRAAALLLAGFAALCWHGIIWDTPTVDEFAHLPAGYDYLRTGRFELFPLNPPLVKVLCALPLTLIGPDIDTAAPVVNTGWYPWVFATDFMQRNRARFDLVFRLGRLPVVALGLLAGLLVWRWTRELHGEEAGLVALLLFAFCPAVIAHAHLATVDVGFSALLLAALYTFHRYTLRPAWPALLLAAAALGAAELAKFTAVLLYPVFLLLAALALARGQRFGLPGWRSRGGIAGSLAALGLIFLLSLAVVDAGYLFEGVGRRAASYRFQSRLLGRAAAALPALPVPLPSAYLEGFDAIQLINETGEFPTYLFGRWSRQGSAAYYLVAILFKTPLPLLAAWLWAPFVRLGRRRQPGPGPSAAAVCSAAAVASVPPGHSAPAARAAGGGPFLGALSLPVESATGPGRDLGLAEAFLWLPAVLLLAAFSLLSRVQYGIRYVLPVLLLAIVYSGRLVPWVRAPGRGRMARGLAAALLALYPVSALLATPDTIAYFNLLAGGRGDRILLDSNLDWGQGLQRVRRAMDRAGLDEIALAYFGHVDPALYGIRWHFPDPRRPGPAAVSANFAHGYPYVTFAGGRMVPVPPDAFSWIGRFPRRADLGGGIFLYEIGGEAGQGRRGPDVPPILRSAAFPAPPSAGASTATSPDAGGSPPR
jgi:hypothetical protein